MTRYITGVAPSCYPLLLVRWSLYSASHTTMSICPCFATSRIPVLENSQCDFCRKRDSSIVRLSHEIQHVTRSLFVRIFSHFFIGIAYIVVGDESTHWCCWTRWIDIMARSIDKINQGPRKACISCSSHGHTIIILSLLFPKIEDIIYNNQKL